MSSLRIIILSNLFYLVSCAALADSCSDQHKNGGLRAASELVLAKLDSVKIAHSTISALPSFYEAHFTTVKVYARSPAGNDMKFKHDAGTELIGNVRDEKLGGIELDIGKYYVLALTLPDLEFGSASVDNCDGSFIAASVEIADAKIKGLLR